MAKVNIYRATRLQFTRYTLKKSSRKRLQVLLYLQWNTVIKLQDRTGYLRRVTVLRHFPALNRMPDTLDKEKIGGSKKREQREEQSQSRYLHTEARGALKGRVEPSRASKGPFYACGRKGSVKLSYRAVYFFISRLDPARAAGLSRRGKGGFCGRRISR